MTTRILIGDVREQLRALPADSVDCVVTSPPYWGLRKYIDDDAPEKIYEIGLERTLREHLDVMVDVFEEVRRVAKPHAPVWINYGDCYATSPNGRSAADTKIHGSDDRTFRDKPFSTVGGTLKPKDLCMIPNRLAIALQDDGWWVRSEIVWGKPNAMPDSSGVGRPSVAHEKIFLLTKAVDADIWRARDTGELSFDPDLTEQCPLITDPDRSAARWNCLGSYYDAAAVMVGRTGDEDAAEYRGGTYCNGEFGPRKVRGNKRVKSPDAWDTGAGGHGSFHREGREKGKTRTVSPRHEGQINHTGIDQTPRGRLLRNYEPAPLTVWEIAIAGFGEAHFATFPPELVARCLRASCPKGGVVLDPFGGSGTTGMVAEALGFDSILIELNPEYADIADNRIRASLGRVQGPPRKRSDLPEMLRLMEAAE